MKMWDGRFSVASHELMERINNSLPFDKVLIEDDIRGSVAWAGALQRCGVLTPAECSAIVNGLQSILADLGSGAPAFQAADEDVHMAVERMLVERIGDAGAKLHTGRSRNDQVVTDLRMWLKKRLTEEVDGVRALQRVLVDRAEQLPDVILPSYTHLQQAQPVLLAHYFLSFFFALDREKGRLVHAYQTADVMPLGSGAVAGSGFPVDRQFLAQQLGFARASENSMDAVASRDFVLETLAALSSLGILLSRYAEDLIIWSTREFGFVELDDAWSTGSSMMPQKKNPDPLELVRGKAGRLVGNYTRFAATLKGVGLTYAKDLQEDKETLFDSVEQIDLMLKVFAGVVATLTVNAETIKSRMDSLLLATDLADYLVGKQIPFRHAHRIVGKVVAHCVSKNTALQDLSMTELRQFSEQFGADVKDVLSWEQALAHRNVAGGTGRQSVQEQLTLARKVLEG